MTRTQSSLVVNGNQPALSDVDYGDQADFRYALRRFLHVSEEHARAEDITPQQHLMLILIRGHSSYPQVAIGQIAERLQVKHHSASLLVDRGVKRGLIHRREDPQDRRRAIVSLTPEGQEILDRITHANRRELESLQSDLFRDSFREALTRYDAGRAN